MKMFAAYDTKIEKFLLPFFSATTKSALRAIETECNNVESNFNKYPTDYVFYELGEWDEVSCKFTLLPAPHSLGLACEYQKRVVDPKVTPLITAQPTKSA